MRSYLVPIDTVPVEDEEYVAEWETLEPRRSFRSTRPEALGHSHQVFSVYHPSLSLLSLSLQYICGAKAYMRRFVSLSDCPRHATMRKTPGSNTYALPRRARGRAGQTPPPFN